MSSVLGGSYHICVLCDFIHTIIILGVWYELSKYLLNNIYSGHSLLLFLSIPSLPTIHVCLPSAAIRHELDLRGGLHTFNGGMDAATW